MSYLLLKACRWNHRFRCSQILAWAGAVCNRVTHARRDEFSRLKTLHICSGVCPNLPGLHTSMRAVLRPLTGRSENSLHREPGDKKAVGLDVFPIRDEAAGDLAAMAA